MNMQNSDSIPQPYRHLLLATDFSSHAELAARRAAQLARLYNARLSLLQVLELPIMYDEFYVGMAPIELDLEKTMQETAEQRLQALAEELGDVVTATELRYGRPKIEIVAFAQEQQVDLIILGSHGAGGLAHLLGTTTDGVNHGAHCDVLSVRLPAATDD
jgi:universal stress protein A